MATEAEVKAQERKELLDETKSKKNNEFSVSNIPELQAVLDTPSQLDFNYNKGIAALMRKRIPLLAAADMASSIIPKATKEALSETLGRFLGWLSLIFMKPKIKNF